MTFLSRLGFTPLELILALALPWVWFGGLSGQTYWLLPLWSGALLLRKADGATRFISIPTFILIAAGFGLPYAPDAWAIVGEFFKLFAVGFALFIAHGMLLEGSRFGLVPLALLLLFKPHPLGLAALLVGLWVLGEAGARLRGELPRRSSTILPLMLGFGLVLVALSALLPRAGLSLVPPERTAGPTTLEPRAPDPTGSALPPLGQAPRGTPIYNLSPQQDPVPRWVQGSLLGLLTAVLLVSVLVIALALWRGQTLQRSGRFQPWHLLLLAAIFVFAAMLMLYLGLAQPNGGGGLGSGTAPIPGGSSDPAVIELNRDSPAVRVYAFISYFLLFSLPLLLGFLLFGVWTLWKFRPLEPPQPPAPAPAEPTVLEPGVIPPLSPDTVRALYARFLELLRGAGVIRLESETPWEFWRTLSGLHPELEDDAHALTWAYMPVRYGELPDREGFEAAFAALERVERWAQARRSVEA